MPDLLVLPRGPMLLVCGGADEQCERKHSDVALKSAVSWIGVASEVGNLWRLE